MPLNIDIQQILLHMLNFTVLFAVMYFLLYKPVKKFMDKRNEYYDRLEEETAHKADEASKILDEYTIKMTNLNNETSNIRVKAVSEANEEAAAIIESAKKQAKAILSDAKNEAKFEKEAIIKAANKEINELAQEAAERIIMENSSKAYDNFIEIISDEDDK